MNEDYTVDRSKDCLLYETIDEALSWFIVFVIQFVMLIASILTKKSYTATCTIVMLFDLPVVREFWFFRQKSKMRDEVFKRHPLDFDLEDLNAYRFKAYFGFWISVGSFVMSLIALGVEECVAGYIVVISSCVLAFLPVISVCMDYYIMLEWQREDITEAQNRKINRIFEGKLVKDDRSGRK